jgi:hypothetical protein
MAAQLNVNANLQSSEQETNTYLETDKVIDQSVKDTEIQNYVTSLVSRATNVDSFVQNFKENIGAAVDSVQKNTVTFSGCMDIEGVNLDQSNKLIQEAKQGFEKMFEDVNKMKRALDLQTSSAITGEQGSTSAQGATGASDQSAQSSQGSEQSSEQKAESFIPRLIMTPQYSTLPSFATAAKQIAEQTDVGHARVNTEAFSIFDKSKQQAQAQASDKGKPQVQSTGGFFSKLFASLSGGSNGDVKEGMCFVGCGNVNLSAQSQKQTTNQTAIDKQKLIQSQDMYKSISSAYDKVNEIQNEVAKTHNETIDSLASAKSSQINELVFTNENACLLKIKNLNIKQSNELQQKVDLQVILKALNSMEADAETKMIAADMMGLTQKSAVDQTGALTTKQTAVSDQTASQKSSQTASSAMSLTMIIVIVAVAVIGFMMYKSFTSMGADGYFDAVGSGSGPVPINGVRQPLIGK